MGLKQAREPLLLLHLQQTQTHAQAHAHTHAAFFVCTWNRFYASSAAAPAALLRAPVAADEAPTSTNI